MESDNASLVTSSTEYHELRASTTKRLDTFQQLSSTPPSSNITYPQWASAGYVYDKSQRALRCVYCLALIANWFNVTSLEALRPHHKPNCDPLGDDYSALQVDDFPEVDGPTLIVADSSSDQQLSSTVNTEIDLSRVRSSPRPRSPRHISPRDVRVVKAENERLKAQMRCRRCGEANVETLFLPCRHLVSCETCADASEDCFLCNGKILGTVRIYLN